MKTKILLLNPPIYDFTGYDFWLKPFGMLSVGGFLRNKCEIAIFDYLDRLDESLFDGQVSGSDVFEPGAFREERLEKPDIFKGIKRYYRRYGLKRKRFREFLERQGGFDFVLVQTVMTYWYLGVAEVIEDVRRFSPGAGIVLGGPYATLCGDHARALGADLVVEGDDLAGLWEFMDVEGPEDYQPPFWEGYDRLDLGVIKLTRGCPFECTYCSVPQVYGGFSARDPGDCICDLDHLLKLGVRDVAFYDDALLSGLGETLKPFLQYVIDRKSGVRFYTPNALHARFVTRDIAELLVKAGFTDFNLGFESGCRDFQKATGGKVYSGELASAVENLKAAGAKGTDICAYHILGHPQSDLQELEESMRFANSLGVRIMLADFSPIPGTADGERCREWIDLDEPLTHNKTAFAIWRLGEKNINNFKTLCKKLNRELK